jgi:hypothetical protein
MHWIRPNGYVAWLTGDKNCTPVIGTAVVQNGVMTWPDLTCISSLRERRPVVVDIGYVDDQRSCRRQRWTAVIPARDQYHVTRNLLTIQRLGRNQLNLQADNSPVHSVTPLISLLNASIIIGVSQTATETINNVKRIITWVNRDMHQGH